MKNTLFTAVLTALVTLAVGFAYNCKQMDCSNCPSVENCKKTTTCGCCNLCVPVLNENETCISIMQMIMQSPAECDEGLLCNPYTKKCTSDHSFLNQLESESSNIPDDVICQGNNSICHCSFEGKILDTYDSLQFSEVTPKSCNCAVKLAKYRKSKLLGKMFWCTSKGSFQNLQCNGSVCFCADEEGNPLKDQEEFEIGNLKNDPC